MTAVGTNGDTRLAALNAELDPLIERRVALHRDAAAKRITTKAYLAGLAEVREAEDRIEPQRRALGATHSRAWELSRPGGSPGSVRRD